MCTKYAYICLKYAYDMHNKYAKRNMQKICKTYTEYAKVYVLAYFAYICTPHLADGSTVTVASGDGQLELCARCQSRNEPELLCSDGRVWIAVLLAAWQVRSRSRPGYRDCVTMTVELRLLG